MYCCKCREKTETVDKVPAISKNNKSMIKGKCVKCHKPKQQFVKNQDIIDLQNEIQTSN